MMLTVKADLKVMMLHQIGRKWRWCQQKSSGIEECCWHQGRILPRWCSIFSRLPSHHHEKASIWCSIGISGTENHLHALPTLHGFYECSVLSSKNAINAYHRLYSSGMPEVWDCHPVFRKFALSGAYAIRLCHIFRFWRTCAIKSSHSHHSPSE